MFKQVLILGLVLILALVVTLPALAACPQCTPCPPPRDWGCSPGFWKNHTGPQYWGPYTLDFNQYPGSQGLGLYEALTQKGWGNKVAKWAAVNFLNRSPFTHGESCNLD